MLNSVSQRRISQSLAQCFEIVNTTPDEESLRLLRRREGHRTCRSVKNVVVVPARPGDRDAGLGVFLHELDGQWFGAHAHVQRSLKLRGASDPGNNARECSGPTSTDDEQSTLR